MNWYFTIKGGHTHVRVFMNGGKCGDLCFRNEEFNQVVERCSRGITFLADDGYNEAAKKLHSAMKDKP